MLKESTERQLLELVMGELDKWRESQGRGESARRMVDSLLGFLGEVVAEYDVAEHLPHKRAS